MRADKTTTSFAMLAILAITVPAFAEPSASDAASVSVSTLGSVSAYPALTRGQVVLVNAQRLVVTQEPHPVATTDEAPPEPRVLEAESDRPTPPGKNAIWVSGHWTYGADGFVWVAGRYIEARSGHVFVPPRWAVYEEQYLFFTGFYVPRNVYVRSHFNRYYYTGAPKRGSQTTNGPYWPVGAPTRANSSLTSANARDPYWPIGVRR
jgi:hypothetical protein